MGDLFGLPIAQLVADALASAGNLQEGILLKSIPGVEDPNDPTAPVPATVTQHSFQGYIEQRAVRRDDTLIAEPTPIMTIIGKSVSPTAEPKVNDRAELAGLTYELERLIRRDPAGAVYEFQVK